MKMKKLSLLFAAMMLFAGSVSSAESVAEEVQTEASSEAQAETSSEAQTEAQTGADAAAGQTGLSEKWSDFQIQIDDQVYQFPMTYQDFVSYGWTSEDSEFPTLEPSQYDLLYFTKDDVRCMAYVINLAKNNMAADQCLVGGISIDSFDWDVSAGNVVLPGGIVRGEASAAAIEEAYGTPSDVYEGDLYKKLTYETDSYCRLEMSVDNETGVLSDIEVRNFVEPEGFDAGEISEEIPAEVTAYAKPDALGDSLEEFRISLDGAVYEVPVPVSVLIADGWELDTSDSDAEVAAHDIGWVTLRKGGQEIREIAVNYADYATIPENCWFETLSVGGYTLEAEGELPCGIKTGMAEADLTAILDQAGVTYTTEADEGSDFAYYKINELAYDQCYELTVYKGDDGHFGKDTVMEVTCRNVRSEQE
ncbi:MAG: hypothetical protein U0M33_13400 [Lachnospiraceae bacterium]|nr:hypothetical protein [Lachnospiraceae bacterium]